MKDNDYRFIGWATSKMLAKNVSVYFQRTKQVEAKDPGDIGFKCAGYFDERLHCLEVGGGMPQKEYFPIFIHEFCHFQQWAEKEPLYWKVVDDNELSDGLWNFLNRKEIKVPKRVIKRSTKAWQQLELNCEKRAVEHIKNFELTVDIEDYIRCANVYVLFYSLLPKLGRWYVHSPYQMPEILEKLPGDWLDDYVHVPDWFETLIVDHCM